MDNNRNTRWLLADVALLVAVFAIYWQTLSFDHVNYDDPQYVFDIPQVLSGLNSESIVWAFQDRKNFWIPLTRLSWMLDASLFGDKPGGFHLTNTVLHALNAIILFHLLTMMTGSRGNSFIVAMLFAIHPLHVESVAWISERKDTLSTFFIFISIWMYAVYSRELSRRWYVLSLFAFLFSLMSKQMYVTLPGLLLLLDIWPLRREESNQVDGEVMDSNTISIETKKRNSNQLVIEKLPFVFLAVLFCLVSYWAQHATGATSLRHSTVVRLENAVLVYGLYLFKTVLPMNMTVFYPHPGEEIQLAYVLLSGVFLSVCTIIAVRQFRRCPAIVVGWLWYLGTLLPVIGLIQVVLQQMADRYTYFSLIGIFIAVVWGVQNFVPAKIRCGHLAIVLTTAALVGFILISYRQVSYWRNSITLLSHAKEVTSYSQTVHFNLAVALHDAGRYEESLVEFELALRDKADAYFKQGTLFLREGNRAEALNSFCELYRLDDNYPLDPSFGIEEEELLEYAESREGLQ